LAARRVEVRTRLVNILRRDLVGPGPQDADLAHERLSENPSRWYLTGFIAPKEDEVEADDPAMQEEDERDAEQELGSGAGGAAGNDEPSDAPVTHRRFLPSSIGLTVLVPTDVASKRGSAGLITDPHRSSHHSSWYCGLLRDRHRRHSWPVDTSRPTVFAQPGPTAAIPFAERSQVG
jgi:hypothetical protein